MKPAKEVKKNRKTPGKKKAISLSAAAARTKGRYISVTDVQKWYRPLKAPVTLRLDGDVLAWFKKAGRGYQTRINRALRWVMEEERKSSGE
jgi:uncharacterized protein (DUF4415 family)